MFVSVVDPASQAGRHEGDVEISRLCTTRPVRREAHDSGERIRLAAPIELELDPGIRGALPHVLNPLESCRGGAAHAVGDPVGNTVAYTVRKTVRETIGDPVINAVAETIGKPVGNPIRETIGDSIRDAVRKAVTDAVHK